MRVARNVRYIRWMPSVTCENVVSVASDFLDNVLDPSERADIDAHLSSCQNCPTYLDQLRTTVEVLAKRPSVQVPEELRQAVDSALSGTGDADAAAAAFREHSNQLYSIAAAIRPGDADDLVESTFTRALEEGSSAFNLDRLTQILLDISDTPDAGEGLVDSVYDHPGSVDARVDSLDADADEAELFYPAFYAEGIDAGGFLESPNAWGDSHLLSPEDDVTTDELYSVVDGALHGLNSFDAAVVALVDVEGVSRDRAAQQLNRSADDVGAALNRGRNHIRGALDGYLRP